ncbi:ParB/RepB/Spo0J family partition protein [Candidatus Woesearchaeota archaeon]|nr:ParB/RepB/Spo0J family partition protein [Candidatus Woesearchaeota archaeon]
MKTELIQVSEIIENEYNPNEMDDNSFQKLVLNIKRKGFRKPLEVRKIDDKYVIIDGVHRFKACKQLGFTEVECIVDNVDETEAMVDTLNANIHGTHNPYKEAMMFKKINQRYKLEDMEKVLNFDQTIIKDRLELLGLPDDIKRQIEDREEKEKREAPVVLSFVLKESEKNLVMEAIQRSENAEDPSKALVEICEKFISSTPKKSVESEPEIDAKLDDDGELLDGEE